MQIRISLVVAVLSLVHGASAATGSAASHPWPTRDIPYDFDGVPAKVEKSLQKAIDRINQLKIVNLHRPANPDFSTPFVIFVYKKNQCSSTFGFGGESSTLVKVSESCSHGSLMHEIFHALGMMHEHLNPLRPFEIRFDRIRGDLKDQFLDSEAVALTPHDPNSIMHYFALDSSICSSLDDPQWTELPAAKLPHVSCRKADWKKRRAPNNGGVDCWQECATFWHPDLGAIGGQREDLTEMDIQGLRKLYPAGN